MKRPSVRQLLPVIVAAIAGLSLAMGILRVSERQSLSAGPAGWRRTTPNVPVLLGRLAGPPNPPEAGWSLASHSALIAPARRVQAVETTAVLPEDGHLEVVFEGSGAQLGVALKLDRGADPYTVVTTAAPLSEDASHAETDSQLLACDRGLPVPTDQPIRARMERQTSGLLVSVTVGGDPPVVASCDWGRPITGATIRSGLRRIGLQSVAVTEQGRAEVRLEAPLPRRGLRWAWGAGGLLLAGLLVGAARLHPACSLRGAPVVLASLPLWMVWPLSGMDLERGMQSLRVLLDQPLAVAYGAPLGGGVVLVLLYLMGVLARLDGAPSRGLALLLGGLLGLAALPAYGAVGIVFVLPGMAAGEGLRVLLGRMGVRGWGPTPGMVLGAISLGGWAALLQPRYGMATTYAATVGMVVAGLIWANVRKIRGFNLLSLMLMVAAVVLADQGLRWTDTGGRLTGRSARARPASMDANKLLQGTFSSFEALENTRQWTDYPSQDYPVEPAPRLPGVTRVVALGGSSTGGAWQNDNLDQFWPAELERRHGGAIQVVNQGVGGWTTLHIRRFLETRLDDADPDVVVLYVGHNDILTESVRPYGALYAAWKSGSDVSVSISGALSGVPLYQLTRFAVQEALGGAVQPAVPLEDARENLEAVVGLLAPRGVRTLLALEGISPDSGVLNPYGAMLRQLAQSHELVGFVDTSAVLTGPGAGAVFLDDCHLTARGHARVAEAVRASLMEQGWIP